MALEARGIGEAEAAVDKAKPLESAFTYSLQGMFKTKQHDGGRRQAVR
jgi:hypothetical protein